MKITFLRIWAVITIVLGTSVGCSNHPDSAPPTTGISDGATWTLTGNYSADLKNEKTGENEWWGAPAKIAVADERMTIAPEKPGRGSTAYLFRAAISGRRA